MASARLHPHAFVRIEERGATEAKVLETVEKGEEFPAKLGRTGFRKNFTFEGKWKGKYYTTKQVEVICVKERKDWLILTVMVKFY